jgi:hypothetical protein
VAEGLYASLKTDKVMHATHMGDMRNAYQILVRKPEGRRPLRRPTHMREDNTRMDQGNGVSQLVRKDSKEC